MLVAVALAAAVCVGLLWFVVPGGRYCLLCVLYYCCLMLSSALALPFMFPWRADPANTKYVAFFLRHLCRWMDLHYEFRDYHHLEFDGPAVIISNHQSAIDILGVFMRLAPNLVPIIKKELMYAGPFGLVSYCAGSVYVDRSDPKQSHSSLDAAVQRAKDQKLKVLVYAEGTRYHSGVGMLPLKKGGFHMAVQAQIPIIPIVYSSYRHFYSKPLKRFLTGGHVIARVLPPIPTEGLGPDDVARLTLQVQESMLPVLASLTQEADERFEAKSA